LRRKRSKGLREALDYGIKITEEYVLGNGGKEMLLELRVGLRDPMVIDG
jgi:hypothetical protein